MNCPRCNADVTAQDKFCPSCGYPMETSKPGGGKKPNKRAYEEASTQLVDVDEFRKYMAEEKNKVNLAGADAAPAEPAAEPAASAAAPAPASKDLSSLSPEALKASGTYEPVDAPKSSNPVMLVLALVVLAAVAYFGFKMMGGGEPAPENAPAGEAAPAGGAPAGEAAPAGK
ncbi:MAG: zinc-ribbon domain-containing protein [Myxococcota bacterium]